MRAGIVIISLLISLALPSSGVGQTPTLDFDTKFYNAVDHWVAFPMNPADSTYPYGFLYIDQMAGFTFHYQSKFKIDNGKIESFEADSSNMVKVRLPSNTKQVSVLSDDMLLKLALPEKPPWLEIYKEDEDSVNYLQRMGYHYNHVGASNKAIPYLLKAYGMEPNYKGLKFELSFAYNATKQFDKALEIAESAIETDPDNPLLYKELGIAYLKTEQFEKAQETFIKGIEKADRKFLKVEMSLNMTQIFLQTKNKEKFEEWLKTAKNYAGNDSRFARHINYLEKAWDGN